MKIYVKRGIESAKFFADRVHRRKRWRIAANKQYSPSAGSGKLIARRKSDGRRRLAQFIVLSVSDHTDNLVFRIGIARLGICSNHFADRVLPVEIFADKRFIYSRHFW